MVVRDLMTKDVQSCTPDMNLAQAAELMWNLDCGAIPVVTDGHLAGIVTDRDICIAVGTRNRVAGDIQVREIVHRDVETCPPDADIHQAMAIMRKAKIRRVPVTDEGQLKGILALNDLIDAVKMKPGEIKNEEVICTIKAICEHRPSAS